MYPRYAEINGKQYALNTDFRVAKECYRIINDETICDEERTLAVIYKIFGFVPKADIDLFLSKTIKFLTCGETDKPNAKEERNIEPDFDINFDESFIEASFQSCYHIDLDGIDYMHWWKFNDLIQGLDKYCILSRVREIRNYNLEEVKDPEERAKIIELQEQLKLPEHISPEEQEKLDMFEALFN